MGYDYVVVGGGSAGCVVAARLSEDPAVKVLLLEAGTSNKHWTINFPLGAAFLVRKKNRSNWGFRSEPEPNLNDRRILCPRGRGLGGSSAINGMVYIRGNSADYDQWASMGLDGWSYDDVLPLFKRSEDHADGANTYHGVGGPLHISNAAETDRLAAAVVQAAIQAGHVFNPDFNGASQDGVGWYDFNLKRGTRRSSAAAFLSPARRRSNLEIRTGAHVTRILMRKGRATGVEFTAGENREKVVAEAAHEVILSAGAVQSPHILQLSGIGDPERLREAGIEPVHALPGVGANFHDHLDLTVGGVCVRPWTLASQLKGIGMVKASAQYLLLRKGILSRSFSPVGGFFKSSPELDRPDHQLVFVPAATDPRIPEAGNAYSLHMCILHPESRGRVDARSSDPFDAPRIVYNHLATDGDRAGMRHCVRLSREIMSQSALAEISGPELAPGPLVQSDSDIDAWVRANAETPYHPVGSCRMGLPDDELAVVDNRLRVFGIEGLRVADASIMPTIVSGNTNAPAVMIGEKVADLIRSER